MFSAFVLVAFIKLLFVTGSLRFVTGLYAAVVGVAAIAAVAAGSSSVPSALFHAVLCGAIAFAYFWSLLRVEPWTGTWWAVVLVGALAVVAIG